VQAILLETIVWTVILAVAGAIAWWLWLLVHIMYLAGFRNRISVLVEWAYAYFTYQRGSRIITAFADEANPTLTPQTGSNCVDDDVRAFVASP